MLIHIKIFGRVQGVGFRNWAVRQANHLNLSGWVRNRISGCVEILADGEATDDFLVLCRKGPLFGRVDRIEAVRFPDAPIPPIEAGLFLVQPTV